MKTSEYQRKASAEHYQRISKKRKAFEKILECYQNCEEKQFQKEVKKIIEEYAGGE